MNVHEQFFHDLSSLPEKEFVEKYARRPIPEFDVHKLVEIIHAHGALERFLLSSALPVSFRRLYVEPEVSGSGYVVFDQDGPGAVAVYTKATLEEAVHALLVRILMHDLEWTRASFRA